MSYNARTSRNSKRRVKLHGLQHGNNMSPGNSALFWCSYESALTWVRNHESIISKFVQFLQIYPNLIQDSSMDTFWDFIESLMHGEKSNKNNSSVHPESVTHKRDAQRFPKHKDRDCSGKGPEIPQISVTESTISSSPAFTISAQLARTPRVHLISRSKVGIGIEADKLLHLGVIDMLQEDFYIRVTSWTHQTHLDISKETHRQYIVAESDVCVYLFNDTTLEDSACFHDLCTALVQKIPIVYVRYHKTQLPKTFSETITKNSNGCITLKDYTDKFMPPSRPATSCTLSVKNSRVKKKLAPLIVGNRSKSANDLFVKINAGLHEKKDRSSQNLDTDLVLSLVSNFKNACIFDEQDFLACSSRLRQEIHYVLGIGKSKADSHSCSNVVNNAENSTVINNTINNYKSAGKGSAFSKTLKSRHSFLSVPDPDDMMSAREWGNFGSNDKVADQQSNPVCEADECTDDNAFFENDARMAVSPSLEHKATTYLIFDQNKAVDGPRKVAFPTECDSASDIESEDYNNASDSPINFHEIDLSREINSRGTPESDISSIF